jgi:hypothetical protein
MRLGATQLDFFTRLGKLGEGQQLLELIQAEIAECNGNLRKMTGESLLREQGKAIFLDELVQRLTRPATAQTVPRRPQASIGGSAY